MPLSPVDVPAYLARLGLEASDVAHPSVAGLRAVHRAHAERIAYTTFDIHLGRTTTVDPLESADRVARLGRGGYCYHANGTLSALLGALGYDVRWHAGGVQPHGAPAPLGATGNHLVLTVHGLPAPRNPDGVWLADVGLGDGLHDPVPLRVGAFAQGPYAFRLGASTVEPGGWRLDHDPAGGFVGMDFAPRVAGPADVADMHRELSTSPSSGFVRVLTAQRRHAGGADVLRGCVLTTVTAAGTAVREVTTRDEWLGLLTGLFGIGVADVSAAELSASWDRVRLAHLGWVAAQAAL